jgi:hypothetical protein
LEKGLQELEKQEKEKLETQKQNFTPRKSEPSQDSNSYLTYGVIGVALIVAGVSYYYKSKVLKN